MYNTFSTVSVTGFFEQYSRNYFHVVRLMCNNAPENCSYYAASLTALCYNTVLRVEKEIHQQMDRVRSPGVCFYFLQAAGSCKWIYYSSTAFRAVLQKLRVEFGGKSVNGGGIVKVLSSCRRRRSSAICFKF